MKIAELPIYPQDFIAFLKDNDFAYADPLAGIESCVQHLDSGCYRIMNYHAIAPITNSFMLLVHRNKVTIIMCRCNSESHLKADWGYSFE
jgi:hypothetical protein